MDEYISKEDALLHSEIIRVYSKDYGNIDVVPVEYLADIPTADVQPVKRGRWIKDEKGTFHHCSECGGKTFRDVDSWGLECQEYCTDYCPHCGARMIEDGDTNERS